MIESLVASMSPIGLVLVLWVIVWRLCVISQYFKVINIWSEWAEVVKDKKVKVGPKKLALIFKVCSIMGYVSLLAGLSSPWFLAVAAIALPVEVLAFHKFISMAQTTKPSSFFRAMKADKKIDSVISNNLFSTDQKFKKADTIINKMIKKRIKGV